MLCPAGISPVFIWRRSCVPPWRSRPRWVLISWFTWIGPRFKQTPGQLSGKGNEKRCFGRSMKTDSTNTAKTTHGNARFTTESLRVDHASRWALSRSRASRISRSKGVSPSIGGVLAFVCSVAGIDGTVDGGPAASAALSSSLSALRNSSRSWSEVRRRSPTTRPRSRATLGMRSGPRTMRAMMRMRTSSSGPTPNISDPAPTPTRARRSLLRGGCAPPHPRPSRNRRPGSRTAPTATLTAEPRAVRIQARAQRETYLATLRADPGHEEQAVGCERAEAPRLVGVRRADHESAAIRRKALDTAFDDALVEGTTCDFEVLEVARARIARPREDKRIARPGRERLDRIEPEVRRNRRRVGVERIEEGVRIRSRSVRYVPTLGIEDHRNLRG